MWIKNKKINLLEKSIEKLTKMLQEGNFVELTYLLGNKKEIIIRNFIAGIFRGIGIGIGVTVITAILIILLQKIHLSQLRLKQVYFPLKFRNSREKMKIR